MSDQSKKHPDQMYPFIFGTLVANMIMFIRVLFIVAIFHVALLEVLMIPLGLMLLTIIVCIYISVFKSRKQIINPATQEHPEFQSPFQIGPALKFAVFIVAIKFLS